MRSCPSPGLTADTSAPRLPGQEARLEPGGGSCSPSGAGHPPCSEQHGQSRGGGGTRSPSPKGKSQHRCRDPPAFAAVSQGAPQDPPGYSQPAWGAPYQPPQMPGVAGNQGRHRLQGWAPGSEAVAAVPDSVGPSTGCPRHGTSPEALGIPKGTSIQEGTPPQLTLLPLLPGESGRVQRLACPSQ